MNAMIATCCDEDAAVRPHGDAVLARELVLIAPTSGGALQPVRSDGPGVVAERARRGDRLRRG